MNFSGRDAFAPWARAKRMAPTMRSSAPTPAIDAVIRLATILAGSDFAATARTLDRMGLAGMDAAQIRRTLDEGFR